MQSLRHIPLVAILPVGSAIGRRCRSASCCSQSSFWTARRGLFAAFASMFDVAAKRISLPGNDFRLPAGCHARSGIGLALIMGTMARRQNNTSHWALFLIASAFAVAGLLTVTAWPKLPEGNADQWRRTAAGWERATQWPTAIGLRPVRTTLPSSSAKAATHPRYDTHPAVLALLQIVGTLTALGMFAAPAPQSFRGWLAMLTQSFRASAFGS